jgi:hypothetical protein
MTELVGDQIIDAMLEALPELRSVYQAAEEFSGKEFGAHVVFGDVLVRGFLGPRLSSVEEDSVVLKRVFDFVERVAAHGDEYARSVVKCTVCEEIGNNRQWLAKARRYMGPETLKLSREIEEFWGRE